MKKCVARISVVLVLLTSILFNYSCQKESVDISKKNKNPISIEKIGEIHNQILDKYYSVKSRNSNVSLKEKIVLIDKYLAEEFNSVRVGEFKKMLDDHEDFQKKLLEICKSNNDIETGISIVAQMEQGNQISTKEKYYYDKLLSIYKENPFKFTKLKEYISNLKKEVTMDETLSEKELSSINSVFSIAISSVKYWEKQDIKPTRSAWYAKDAVGALYSVQSNAVELGCSIFGPIGGAIVCLGISAISSAV